MSSAMQTAVEGRVMHERQQRPQPRPFAAETRLCRTHARQLPLQSQRPPLVTRDRLGLARRRVTRHSPDGRI